MHALVLSLALLYQPWSLFTVLRHIKHPLSFLVGRGPRQEVDLAFLQTQTTLQIDLFHLVMIRN